MLVGIEYDVECKRAVPEVGVNGKSVRAETVTLVQETEMRETAEKFLEWNQPQPMSFVEKYEKLLAQRRSCPLCGGKMVKRVAKKGAYAGEEFWGCENFPHCRHMEKII